MAKKKKKLSKLQQLLLAQEQSKAAKAANNAVALEATTAIAERLKCNVLSESTLEFEGTSFPLTKEIVEILEHSSKGYLAWGLNHSHEGFMGTEFSFRSHEAELFLYTDRNNPLSVGTKNK